MSSIDFIIIATSETIRYEQYSSMPLERIDLYRNLVQLRMVYYDGGFHSHLDLMNKIIYGKYFYEATYKEKRNMLSIWNMPALNAELAINPLVHEGFNCRIVNNFDAEFDLLCEYCSQMEKPVVGISTTFILQWSEIGRISRKIHDNIPNATIILGGAFVYDQYITHGAQQFEKPMRKFGINYLLFNYNSENDLLALLSCIRRNEPEINVNNIAFIDPEDVFRISESIWNNSQVNGLPVQWDLMDRKTQTRTVQLRTSSGCPFRCAFCNYSTMARNFSYSTINQIQGQLDSIKSIGGIESLVFIDDNLNVPDKRFRQMLKLLKQYEFRWYAFMRVQFVNDDVAHQMKLSGCDGVYLGLESGNDMILNNMNKKATTQDYQQGIDLLKENDIKTFASFIVGFPGETQETIDDTISFIGKSGLDFYSLKEFYYLHTASIHSHSKDFELEGEGHTWKHRTMSSAQASEMKLLMFDSIKKSIHVDPDMGLWCLAYLRDRGFSWDQIVSIHETINEMMRRDNSDKWLEKMDLFEKLKICANTN